MFLRLKAALRAYLIRKLRNLLADTLNAREAQVLDSAAATAQSRVGQAEDQLRAEARQAEDQLRAEYPQRDTDTINRTLGLVRGEYTVMPRFAFHQPLDYLDDTFPPDFGAAPVVVDGEPLPLPPAGFRGGYPADDAEYLEMGRDHYRIYLDQIDRHHGLTRDLSVMEFGCATGRILRHFHRQREDLNWKLIGCDVQADHVEWMRQNWPRDICVYVGSVFPKLPFEDNSLDVIYGMSVFTHIKYHWDFWLLELRRVLKPGGLLLQTVHTERAWEYYYRHRQEDWVKAGISAHVLDTPQMDVDFLLSGDLSVSQVFFRKDVARAYWGRYFQVADIVCPDSDYWFQDMMVCIKP